MHVVVTGASGHLAQAVLPALCADASISAVTGVDIHPTCFRHAKFLAVRLPIGHPDIGYVLRGHDALVNLAFRVLRGRMTMQQMEEVNLRDQQHLFSTAAGLGSKRMIHLSSAAVYGVGSQLREDAPFRPLPGFAYAEHKAKLELWLAQTLPQCVRLRPHIILGPHALPLLRQLLRSRFYVRLADPQPRLQCVHEDDVAAAIMACLNRPVEGAFNLASPQTYTLLDAAQSDEHTRIGVSKSFAQGLLNFLWRWRGWGGEPGWFAGIDQDLTLDCSRAFEELAWRPKFSALDAIAAARRA